MKSYFVLICLLSFVSVTAQKQELGKVTVKELEEKVHSKDSSAVAAILFKKAKTTFEYTIKDGFYSVTEFSVKIKIYKKEGLDWANYEIPYYVGYKELNDDYVEISKAYTYNLLNGKILETKVTSESKFTEKNNEFWKTKTISFPNVVAGSIIELKYKLRSQNISVLPEFQYQYKIPVNYAEYKTEIPELYIYKGMKTGYVDIQINEKIIFSSTNYSDKYAITNTINFRQVNTTYIASDIPSLTNEAYVNNIDNYFAKIENELQVIRFPDEEPKQIATTWESVAKSVFAEPEFGLQIDKYKYFLTDLKNLISESESDIIKITKIFDFVKTRMTWNGKYGYYTRMGVETAYQEKSGNVAEINFILIAMLRLAKINTDPVLISTRDNGLALFPNRTKFNYVIAAVSLNEQKILLDATSKLSTVTILPIRDLNNKGRLIYKNGTSEEIDLMPKIKSSIMTYLIVEIDNKGKVIGKVKQQYSNYKAFQFRTAYLNVDKESYIEKLEKSLNGTEISSYEIKNETSLSEPIVEYYSIICNNATDIIGDKIYFSPLLNLLKTQNPFNKEERLYPIDFTYPSQNKYSINIKIPEGYEIESLPKSTVLKIEEGYLNFNYAISAKTNQIVLNLSFDVNQSIIPAENYVNLKEFFKFMIEKESEKVILKKI